MSVTGRNIVPACDREGESQCLQADAYIFGCPGAVRVVFLFLYGQVEQAAAVTDEIIPQRCPGQLQHRQRIHAAAP